MPCLLVHPGKVIKRMRLSLSSARLLAVAVPHHAHHAVLVTFALTRRNSVKRASIPYALPPLKHPSSEKCRLSFSLPHSSPFPPSHVHVIPLFPLSPRFLTVSTVSVCNEIGQSASASPCVPDKLSSCLPGLGVGAYALPEPCLAERPAAAAGHDVHFALASRKPF